MNFATQFPSLTEGEIKALERLISERVIGEYEWATETKPMTHQMVNRNKLRSVQYEKLHSLLWDRGAEK